MGALLLWGAGGHGRVVLDVASAAGFHSIVFVDDQVGVRGSTLCGFPIHSPAHVQDARETLDGFMICIGNNRVRAQRFAEAHSSGLTAVTLIHPTACISPSASLGPGTVVMPRAVVNANAIVGENCILNTGSIVEHDCSVGHHAHISPGAVLGGGARVGDFAHVGINAGVLPGARIEHSAIVGAGAIVLKYVPAGATAIGVPAHVVDIACSAVQHRGDGR